MSKVAFKQCDIERALRASSRVGVAVVVRIERATGDLLIMPAAEPVDDGAANASSDADLDEELRVWRQQHGDG